jgi:hypothetical protein
LRAGEFLNNALGLKDPMMLLLITSQSVGWMDRVWIDHLQACSGNKNGLQFSCHIALHCCYFQWKISAMAAAAAACLCDV